MSLYQDFTYKSSGNSLLSIDDFTNAIVSTVFEKNTGDLYIKTGTNTYDKVARKYYSQIDIDSLLLNKQNTLVAGTNITISGNTISANDTSVAWSEVTSKPTTLAGLGITDIYSKTQTDTLLDTKQNTLIAGTNITISGSTISANDTSVAWSEITSKPTSISGYAISDAYTKTQTDTLLGTKQNTLVAGTNITISGNTISANDTSVAWTEVTGKPTTLDGLGITDIYSKTDSDARFLNATGDNTLSGDILPTTNNTRSLGSSTLNFANVYSVYFRGTATTALYADLAEKYETDKEYPVGTVLEIGGEKEATLFQGGPLAGVVSENPAYMMNSEGKGQYIALKGKVPVKCESPIKKGQYCIAIPGGIVEGVNKITLDAIDMLDIVGVAIEDSKDNLVMVKI